MNPYIILVLQILLAGGTHVVAKAATESVPPAVLTFLRTLISSTLYVIYIIYARLPFKYRGKDLALICFLGLISVPVNQFIFLYGIKRTTATNAALLYSLTPVIVMFISHFYLKEKITITKASGALMALSGVIIIIAEKGITLGLTYIKGDLLVFSAVIAWALYTVLGRKLVIKHGAINTTIYSALIGSIVFAPFGIAASVNYSYSAISVGTWMEIIYLGIITSIVGYVLWYYALSKIEASRVAVFTNGQPIATAVLSAIFLGQVITLTFIIGAIITITGVLITQQNQSRKISRADVA
ncbi:MAG: DMT family transporter [Candidatus Kryptoniota bacterium]